MEPVKKAANYVTESIQSATAGVSKETNKEVAKDSNNPIGTRASAAKDALGDKFNESKHDARAETNKQSSGTNNNQGGGGLI